MRSVQTALRSNKQRPGYSTFACTGHKWEDDYLYHSCRSLASGMHVLHDCPLGALHPMPATAVVACSSAALWWGRHQRSPAPRRFHDICLNHTSMEFQYYVDPAAAETPLFYHYLNGHPHYTFPQDFIMTGHVHILPYTPWAPKVSLCVHTPA